LKEQKITRTGTKKERCTYEGLLLKITSLELIYLELMYDALQELSALSLHLQERNIDLNKAHNKIVCLVNVFESRRNTPVLFYRESLEAADTPIL
jgi:hypothetical protein